MKGTLVGYELMNVAVRLELEPRTDLSTPSDDGPALGHGGECNDLVPSPSRGHTLCRYTVYIFVEEEMLKKS